VEYQWSELNAVVDRLGLEPKAPVLILRRRQFRHPDQAIARGLALAKQSVLRVADLPEREGLAVCIDNPRHRRAKLGRAALDDIQARQRAWADVLGEEDLRPWPRV
jgi:hypothetical protein